MTVDVARRAWQLLEPIHAVTYFAPESVEALREAGYRGYWMGYFAARSAPLGAVGPDVVHALFYNFTHDRVAGALPDAWGFASPEVALATRSRGAVAALRRALGPLADSPAIVEAAELAQDAVAAAPAEGRPLFAANRALPAPDDPVAALWQAATTLREHRGDGHNATLLEAGVGGLESHVLAALARGFGPHTYRVARDIDDVSWQRLLDGLRSRGLADATGLTGTGRALRERIEDDTDRLAAPAYDEIDTDRLLALLQPLADAVVAAGDIPTESPMGLDLRDVGGDEDA